MMNSLSALVSYLVNSVWQVAMIAGFGWIASRFLRRFGPQAEHVAWVVTLVAAVFTPAAPLIQTLSSVLLRSSSAGGPLSIALAAEPEAGSQTHGSYQLPAAAIWLLAVLYLCVLVYCAARLVWSIYRTNSLIGNARPLVLSIRQEEIWNRCKRLYALNNARILASRDIGGPVSLGFRRPVLLVPDGFVARCAPSDLLIALAHECAHARRRDFQKNLFYEAISVVLAFHPAIWVIKSQIAQTREMICDSMVAEKAANPRVYAQSLLRLAALIAEFPQTAAVHAIGIFDANILEKRIMRIGLKRRRFGRLTRYVSLTPALLLLCIAAVVAAAKAVVIEPQSTNQTTPAADKANPYGPIYKIGDGVSPPVPTNNVEAEFPKSGKKLKKGFHAIVIVYCIVDKEGMPRDPRVSKSYNPDFDKEAVKAVEKYRFKPAQKAGTPVAVAINIEVNFTMF